MPLFHGIAIFGAIAAAVAFVWGMQAATSAPQQSAAAGIALCLAIIPYVLARSIDGLMARPAAASERSAVGAASEAETPPLPPPAIVAGKVELPPGLPAGLRAKLQRQIDEGRRS